MSTETKSQAWARLAQARALKVNHYLRSVGKLTNRSHYEWTDNSAQKLLVIMFRSLLVTCDKYKLNAPELFEAAQRQHHLIR